MRRLASYQHHLDHHEHPFSRTHATQGDEEAHGILEGISSLHSWIKTQTMIRLVFFFLCLLVFVFSFQITHYSTRPTKLGKKKDDMSFDDVSIQKLERLACFLFSQDDDDDVVISLCSRDPQAVKVRIIYIFTHFPNFCKL